ncbi:MAG: hypothetical protein LBF75_00830, partial [Treponema sp.]|nr:hypothetical protein [Treponema sp.]
MVFGKFSIIFNFPLGIGNRESRERVPCSWFMSFFLHEGSLIHLLKDQFVLGGRSVGSVIFSR